MNVSKMRRKGRRFYELQWTDPVTGLKKTESTGETLDREAEKARARKSVELAESRGQIKTKSNWQEFVDALCAEVLDNRSENHRRRVLCVLGMFHEVIKPRSAAVITDDEVAEFAAWLRRQRVKPKKKGDKPKRKTQETTIKSHLGNLRLAFRFAARRRFMKFAPQFEMPKGTDKPKGRPITREELERMIGKLSGNVPDDEVAAWTFLLNGLWWGGLRIGEAVKLDWYDDREIAVDFRGKHPVFRIQALTDKGRESRPFPMAPGFARLLQTVPEARREGRVFRAVGIKGEQLGQQQVEKVIVKLGKLAGVRVAETKCASAHDLRRTFATRWAMRVRPFILQRMMRHKSISTTNKYYVDADTQDVAGEVWKNDADATNTSANTEAELATIIDD